jgi:endonuclease/exonuclease/phosphatase (EEP) superfamily protein YafD
VWLALVVGVTLIHPLGHALGRASVAFDLISQFQVVGLIATTAGLVVSALLRSRLAWWLATLALLQSAPLLETWLPARAPLPSEVERPLRMLVANILFVNQNHEAIRRLIESERPDVVGLIEVSKHHLRALPDLAGEYPVRAELPRHDSHGLALWSRNPADGPVELIQPTAEGAPVLRAHVHLNGRKVNLYLVHTEMPFFRMRFERGFGELAWLREEVAAREGPVIVAGDLNSTETSPHFEDLLRLGRLRDTRQSFGPQPSWPTWSPLRLSLDHVLVSGGIGVVDRRLGPPFGSDHLPVVVDLVAEGPEPESSRRSVVRKSSQP